MTSPSFERTVTVVNPQGLHARPADLLVRLAKQFGAEIEIIRDNRSVDGNSILSILTLAAEQGTQLTIRASGRNAKEALAALADLIESGFVQDAHDGQLASEH